MTSCIKPATDGGVPNVEYYTIKGLKEKKYKVEEFFPYKYSKAITDFSYGLKGLKFNGIIHAHTNISWNTPNAIRTFHGATALGEEIALKEKKHVLKSGLNGDIYLQVNKLFEKKCAQTNNCITVSQYIADALTKYYNTPKEKIRVIHNGVDNNKFFSDKKIKDTFRKSIGLNENDFVITWTGHFEFNKGIYYLCKIIEELKNEKEIKFLVRSSVKKGNIPKEYEKTLFGNNVIYLDHGLNMNEFYNAGNCHLLTSTYEPFCLTILEAMCAKKPVIATYSGGHTEVIEDGKNGFLFEYNEIKKIAQKIKSLSNNPKEEKIIAAQAQKTILSNFTYKHMVNKTIEAYKYFNE